MLLTRPAPESAETASASLFFTLGFAALLGLLALAPWELSGFWPSTYDFWPQAMWLLLSAGATFLLAMAPEARPRFDLAAKLLLAFLAWSALSIATAIYRHDAILEWARIAGALLPFWVVRAAGQKRVFWIVLAWVVGVAGNCFPAIWNFLQTQYPRQAGPYSNNNLFANALAMTLPLALILPVLTWQRFASRGLARLATAPFWVCAGGLLVTSSKGGFLAAFLALGVTTTAIWSVKKSVIRAGFARHRAVLSGALLILGLGFGLLAAKMIAPRLQSALGSEKNSTLFRVYVWRATLDMARDKPLLGYGAGAFPHIYPRYALVSHTYHAHQSWLQVAAENGVPALLLLLGAVGVALKSGVRRLTSRDWPLMAGAMGTVAALLVHGSVDSGFQTASILIFLATALGTLTLDEAPTAPTPSRLNAPTTSRLNLFWIGATLVLAWGGNMTQKAASGENLRAEADQFPRNGAPSIAIQKMREATLLDPNSARAWSNLGRLQEDVREDGTAALQTAADLQPTRAANWLNLARAALQNGDLAAAERFYDRAIAQAPRETTPRLERAQFRLGTKNSAGYADLEAILAQKTAPYGLYEPVEQLVNLDFARAALLLAPELRRRGQTARLRALVQSGLADCARARRFAAQNEAMRREMGLAPGSDDNADLENLAGALQALQTPIK